MKGSPAVYAELLAVAAHISWLHGKRGEALDELYEAEMLDPLNHHVQRQLAEY